MRLSARITTKGPVVPMAVDCSARGHTATLSVAWERARRRQPFLGMAETNNSLPSLLVFFFPKKESKFIFLIQMFSKIKIYLCLKVFPLTITSLAKFTKSSIF